MAQMDSFVEYALELLEPLGPVQARAMFGGWGLYFGGVMFGLIVEGSLFLKVDDVTRPAFEAAGCEPFVYQGARKPTAMSYWTPPADAQDDAHALLPGPAEAWKPPSARREEEEAGREEDRRRRRLPRRRPAGEEGPAPRSPAA